MGRRWATRQDQVEEGRKGNHDPFLAEAERAALAVAKATNFYHPAATGPFQMHVYFFDRFLLSVNFKTTFLYSDSAP